MTPLNFEDTSSIDTFPLATFHTDSLQPDTTTTPDWQRLNTIINQRSNRARHNQNPAVTEKILRATNYHWVAGQLEHPLTRTNYHWEVPCQTIYVPTPTDIVPLDDISMSSLDTLVSTTMMTDDHSLQDTFSISTISDFSFEEHNNPGFTHTTPPHDNAMGTTDIVTTPIHPEPTNLSLTDEVHRIVTGTSQKFVPHPPFDVVATDAFKGLKRFATTVRLKEDFINQQKQQHDNSTTTSNSSSSIISALPVGLKTNLKPTRCCGTAQGSHDLELFLKDLNRAVLNMVYAYQHITSSDPTTQDIHHMQQLLRNNPDIVVVPTDKTNSFSLTSKQFYISQVLQHLSQRAKPISHSDLHQVKVQGLELLRKIKPHLSSGEYGFISQSLRSHAIPTPKLTVKDHKHPDENGNYPTRLLVPAQNFVAAYPKMGYLAIKKIFEEHNIDYRSKTIIQSVDLKTKLETLNLNPNNCTIVSLDAEAFYPSVRYKLVEKAVKHFSKHLPQSVKDTIALCMEMIQFGMQSTYLVFQDRYYEYDGDQNPAERGLTIGGHESAWLADLTGAYALEETEECFEDTIYEGLYRDDGFLVFLGKRSYDELLTWRNTFQDRINQIAEGDYLQFTMEIWAASDTQPITHPIIDKKAPVQVNTATHFPYLDLDLYWQNQQNLQFKVHLKPNQQLLYLNKGSSHTSTCFDSIPRGVCHRLAKLTTVTEDNADTSLQDLYPDHFAALKHANLINKHTMPKIPTLREANHIFKPKSPTNRQLQQKKRDARRTTYFCIGYSKAWTTPIWKVIQNLIQNKYPTLKWIRPAMSYHRFTNLREIFNGDIMTKLNTGIVSLDFTTRPCNCTNRLTDGCAYNNHCRKPIVIYEATSTQPPNPASSPKSYIGATQNFLKLRMSSHVSETKRLCQFLRGKKHKPKNSDTFAWHFAAKAVATTTGDPTASDIRKLYNLKILWQGNPLSTVKTFGTNDCILCNQERLHIFKRMRNKPSTLLNRCEELFNTCRHKPRFHRFTHATPVSSTDEPSMGEKVPTTIDV